MEGGMENAAARGKLALALPIVGANLKNQQRPQRKKIISLPGDQGRYGRYLDMARYGKIWQSTSFIDSLEYVNMEGSYVDNTSIILNESNEGKRRKSRFGEPFFDFFQLPFPKTSLLPKPLRHRTTSSLLRVPEPKAGNSAGQSCKPSNGLQK